MSIEARLIEELADKRIQHYVSLVKKLPAHEAMNRFKKDTGIDTYICEAVQVYAYYTKSRSDPDCLLSGNIIKNKNENEDIRNLIVRVKVQSEKHLYKFILEEFFKAEDRVKIWKERS